MLFISTNGNNKWLWERLTQYFSVKARLQKNENRQDRKVDRL